MRIAITGSSGYLGRLLAAALSTRAEVESVIGLDIASPEGSAPVKFRFHPADVRRPFAELLRREGVTAAVHLAFTFGPTRRLRAARAINLDGTRNFLDACRETRLSRVIVLGSAIAYGARRDNPPALAEDRPLRAGRGYAYAYHKRLCDEMCRRFSAECPTVRLAVLRPPIVLGRHVDNYFSRMFFKPKVVYPRGADPAMQFVHEDDLCAAVVALLQNDAVGPFNLAPEGSIRFSELAWEFKRAALGMPYSLLWAVCAFTYSARLVRLNETPPGALPYIRYPWLVSGERLRAETGFVPVHSTLDTVRAWRRSVLDQAAAGRTFEGKFRI